MQTYLRFFGTRSRGRVASKSAAPGRSLPPCSFNPLLRHRARVISRTRSARKLKQIQESSPPIVLESFAEATLPAFSSLLIQTNGTTNSSVTPRLYDSFIPCTESE